MSEYSVDVEKCFREACDAARRLAERDPDADTSALAECFMRRFKKPELAAMFVEVVDRVGGEVLHRMRENDGLGGMYQ